MELELHVGFFKKLDFCQIEFQNRGIFLNSFRQGAFCWKVSTKGVFCHFGHIHMVEPKANHNMLKNNYLTHQIVLD